ncbi:MAG: tetratricopeptide repeat protein [Geobacteraceae bacterium]|nr:tetratricopeptide repeat protein [Geobacteraceae bacterium]
MYILAPLTLVLFSNPALLFQSDISTAFLAMTAEKGAPARLDYLLSQFPVVIKYLQLFILPVGQNLDHDMAIKSSFFNPEVLSSFLVLVALLMTAIFFIVRGRKTEIIQAKLLLLSGFGILWFFVTISLESGIVPIRDLMFEQRLYIPSIGLVITVSAMLVLLLSKEGEGGRSYRTFSIVIVVMAIILSIMSFYRNIAWQSEISIWEDAVSKSPGKGRTHGALGHAYQRAKMWPEAEKEYLEALRLSSYDHIAANNLGVVYLKQKRYAEAVILFKKGIELVPTTSAAHFNLGLAYAATGSYPEAIRAFEEAIRHKPDYREAKDNLNAVKRLMEH